MLQPHWFSEIMRGGPTHNALVDCLHQRRASDHGVQDEPDDVASMRFSSLRMPFYGEHAELVRIEHDLILSEGTLTPTVPRPASTWRSNAASSRFAVSSGDTLRLETFVLFPEGLSDPSASALWLDGTSPRIHELNRRSGLTLDPPDERYEPPDANAWDGPPNFDIGTVDLAYADLYLRFFCDLVWGKEGPFRLLTSHEDVIYNDTESDAASSESDASEDGDRKADDSSIEYPFGEDPQERPLRENIVEAPARDEDDDAIAKWRTKRRVQYADALFDSAFAVNVSPEDQPKSERPAQPGMIEMEEDASRGDIARRMQFKQFGLPWLRAKEGDRLTWRTWAPPPLAEKIDGAIARTERHRRRRPKPQKEIKVQDFLDSLRSGQAVRDAVIKDDIRHGAVRVRPEPNEDVPGSKERTPEGDERAPNAARGSSPPGEGAATPFPRPDFPCDVSVENVWFEGELNLRARSFGGSVEFIECTFAKPVDLAMIRIAGALVIDGCHAAMSGGAGIDLTDAEIGGSVVIEDVDL